MILNGVKHSNKKKATYYSQCSSNFNRILFFILKIPIFKRDDLIKNDDIKPDWNEANFESVDNLLKLTVD